MYSFCLMNERIILDYNKTVKQENIFKSYSALLA